MGAGLAPVGLTTAAAVPEPTLEPLGQAAGPSLTRVSSEQTGKPFVFIFRPLGEKISMREAVVPAALLLEIASLTLTALGFLLVPALDGLTVMSTVCDGVVSVCAIAPPANARDAARPRTIVGVLRKGSPPQWGQVQRHREYRTAGNNPKGAPRLRRGPQDRRRGRPGC